VIYTEISVRFDRIEDINRLLDAAQITLAAMPREALFLAGKAYQRYRQRGGTRTGTLPDFFIGAHASVMDAPVMTRDASRYAGYFPALKLIAPDAEAR
jgi:predicted nucleic acid-binding protein